MSLPPEQKKLPMSWLVPVWGSCHIIAPFYSCLGLWLFDKKEL